MVKKCMEHEWVVAGDMVVVVVVGECRSFSDIIVSQGSVAMHVGCGGIFIKYFAANLLENLPVKKFG